MLGISSQGRHRIHPLRPFFLSEFTPGTEHFIDEFTPAYLQQSQVLCARPGSKLVALKTDTGSELGYVYLTKNGVASKFVTSEFTNLHSW